MPGEDLASALQRLGELDRRKEQILERLELGERRFRRLARSVWNVQEDERRRLARELHDGVGQTLTALKNELELVRRLGGDLPPEASRRLQLATELAGRALADTREMSRLLRPQLLDDLGLRPALEWLCRTLAERSGMEVDLQVELPRPLDSELQTLAFRVVQEATNNAEKHSGARRVAVEVVADRELRITVSDDGRGLAAGASTSPERSSGLRGMRDRVDLFDGRLEVSDSAAGGVRVSAVVPLEDPSRTEEGGSG